MLTNNHFSLRLTHTFKSAVLKHHTGIRLYPPFTSPPSPHAHMRFMWRGFKPSLEFRRLRRGPITRFPTSGSIKNPLKLSGFQRNSILCLHRKRRLMRGKTLHDKVEIKHSGGAKGVACFEVQMWLHRCQLLIQARNRIMMWEGGDRLHLLGRTFTNEDDPWPRCDPAGEDQLTKRSVPPPIWQIRRISGRSRRFYRDISGGVSWF